jgi:2-amino-4-hydroxy-6-hydroxymethyldihydropteridine diphosphokinase
LSTAYISIGSNLGDRLEYVREAITKIKLSKEVEICKVSSVYETEPELCRSTMSEGLVDKGSWFLNMVLELETSLEPLNLLELLLEIEGQMGRKRTGSPGSLQARRYGPRNIDLDLLLYDDLALNSDTLTLPHPRMHERRFVLVPLVEIAPQVVHPLLKKSIQKILEELSINSAFGRDEFEVRLYSEKVL